MAKICIEISEIPHGHGMSFKKGVADGLLGGCEHEDSPHITHSASYRRGVTAGSELKIEIAKFVKE